MHGSEVHTGAVLSNEPRLHVIVSHVYPPPVKVCVQLDPLVTLWPSVQLELAPAGVIAELYVHGSGVQTGDVLSNEPVVHVIVSHE